MIDIVNQQGNAHAPPAVNRIADARPDAWKWIVRMHCDSLSGVRIRADGHVVNGGLKVAQSGGCDTSWGGLRERDSCQASISKRFGR